jgi:hypothetical protein
LQVVNQNFPQFLSLFVGHDAPILRYEMARILDTPLH